MKYLDKKEMRKEFYEKYLTCLNDGYFCRRILKEYFYLYNHDFYQISKEFLKKDDE